MKDYFTDIRSHVQRTLEQATHVQYSIHITHEACNSPFQFSQTVGALKALDHVPYKNGAHIITLITASEETKKTRAETLMS